MKRLLPSLLCLGFIAAACGSDAASVEVAPLASVPGVVDATTSAPVDDESVEPVTDQELATLVQANNEFALDLYRTIAPDADPNLALGPSSISEGLALPYVGTRGDTAAEMAEVLRYDLSGDTQHAAFSTLRRELLSRQSDGLTITIANRLFGQEGLGFLDEFLADQSRYYGSPLATVDFAGDSETAREAINDWTAAQTNDRITDLFPPGTIDTSTRLAVVNAIHFDADWKYEFDPERTTTAPFTRADGSEVDVEMMHYDWSLPSTENEIYAAVRLPYVGDEMSLVAVQARGDLSALESSLDAALVREIQAELIEEDGIHLAIPKFDISSHTSLIGPLRSLGLSAPFDNADFSGITNDADLFIGASEHEAFITIDETGTEAGAATGTAMAVSHGLGVVLNRPFLFWVQDDVTGALLFLGRVGDPSATG